MNDASKFSEAAMAQYFEACRGQYECGLALVNALVAGAERLRGMQLEAARDTKAKQGEIAGRIAKAASLQDLLILQSELMSEYCMRAVAYWSKLAEVARETQAELARVLAAQASQAMQQAKAPAVQGSFDAARQASEAFIKAMTSAYPLLSSPKKPAKATAQAA